MLVLASRRNNLFKFAIAKTRSPTHETRVLPGFPRRCRFMSGAWCLGFGALVFASMAQVTIETIKNGPYIVTGEVELIDADGTKFPVEKRMALCRCGASTEKPFCDGTHSKIGFQAAEKAVPESKE